MIRKVSVLGLLVWAAIAVVGSAQDNVPRTIVGWGAVVDPGGDCEFRADNRTLSLRVPAGVHDLWVGQSDAAKRFNAPRVVREIGGDFVAQVKVTADWKPKLARYYNGAGLLVWNSESEYFRLERNHCINSKGQAFCYTSPLHDRAGKRVNAVKATADEHFRGRSTWLRIQRTGKILTTEFSHDGKEWTQVGELTTELGPKVWIGIHAVNNAAGEFLVQFEDFKIDRR